MKGGLKLKNPSKQGFTPVMDMIEKGRLSLLTAASLKGFMIKLDVDKADSEYAKLDDTGTFREPVVSYILKMVVIKDRVERIADLVMNKVIHKFSDTYESLFEEAKVQQTIWENSIIGGADEICPSVANLAFFTDTDLLETMRNKAKTDANPDPKLELVLTYLIENQYQVGVLTMPTVTDSKTLGQFCRQNQQNLEMVTDAKVSVAVNVIRLFLQGVIHLDLHMGNALVFETNKGISSRLIDFGAITGVTDTDLQAELQRCLFPSRQLRDSVPTTNEAKSNIIRRTLLAINAIDHHRNITVFRQDYSQMKWVLPTFLDVNNPASDNNNLLVFQGVLKESAHKSTLSKATIASYKKLGYLITLDTVDNFLPDSVMAASASAAQPTQAPTAAQPTQATSTPPTQAPTSTPPTQAPLSATQGYTNQAQGSRGGTKRKRRTRKRKRSRRIRF